MFSMDNLIPMNERGRSEAQRLGSKGGLASGASRRRRRDMQAALSALLEMPLRAGDLDNIKNLSEVKGRNITAEQAILLAQVTKAIKGDTRAATFIRDTVGCKPSENVRIEEVIPTILSDEIFD